MEEGERGGGEGRVGGLQPWDQPFHQRRGAVPRRRLGRENEVEHRLEHQRLGDGTEHQVQVRGDGRLLLRVRLGIDKGTVEQM